jgi:hypothetical protein
MVEMGKVMSLRELVTSLEPAQADKVIQGEDAVPTIFASEPWTPDSRAIVIEFEGETVEPPPQARDLGCTYLIEVFIAQEFLAGLPDVAGQDPTPEEKCMSLIEYAINDA